MSDFSLVAGYSDPFVAVHLARISDGGSILGSAFVYVSPREAVDEWTALEMDEDDAGWLVEFERVQVDQGHLGQRYGLRLVAEALAHFTRGRTCLVTLVAEPKHWESLRQRDREPALIALNRHWSQLGFDGGAVRADDVRPRLTKMVARDFVASESVFAPVGR